MDVTRRDLLRHYRGVGWDLLVSELTDDEVLELTRYLLRRMSRWDYKAVGTSEALPDAKPRTLNISVQSAEVRLNFAPYEINTGEDGCYVQVKAQTDNGSHITLLNPTRSCFGGDILQLNPQALLVQTPQEY